MTTATTSIQSAPPKSNDEAFVLIDGSWRAAVASGTFAATNPSTGVQISEQFPISTWSDIDAALNASVKAFEEMRSLPAVRIAEFLELFANKIEASKDRLVAIAHEETGLPKSPRLSDVELPRTYNQLRAAAAATRSGSWAQPTIDSKANIRSVYEALGPICVFGPNNFPFAFNSLAGGDFAAAIAAGNPVIGKSNTSHPGTTKLFAELAWEAINELDLPRGMVQLIYRTSHEDGERMVSDIRIGATGYTGSRHAGLKLYEAASKVGKPFYAELSSVNPVVILPGAMNERRAKLVEDFVASGLAAVGQMCTSPGIVLLIDSPDAHAFISEVADKYKSSPAGTLLSKAVQQSLHRSVKSLVDFGATLVTGGDVVTGERCALTNTILQATGKQFLQSPHDFQTEAFGNAALFVVCKDLNEVHRILGTLEGNLTGSIYSHTGNEDDAAYALISKTLVSKVGRFLNDKMPTGVAVTAAMNHGGPFPATSHPGFTAVGIPGSMLRFAKLSCYDAVRQDRLPVLLMDKNPTGKTWRSVDGHWTVADLPI
jgi:NADP-dependent aldehyde dehydrogenase